VIAATPHEYDHNMAVALLMMLAFVAPIIVGATLLLRARHGGKGYPACGACGYNLTGTLHASRMTCPECGGELGDVGVLPAQSRNNPRWMWLGVAVLGLPLLPLAHVWIATEYAPPPRPRSRLVPPRGLMSSNTSPATSQPVQVELPTPAMLEEPEP
jgi:hypothetical protein